jgi:hypothetical protein
VALRIPGVGDPLEQANLDKHPESGRQRGSRDVEVAGELTEAPHPEE